MNAAAADVLVVGAGVIGAATAFHLTRMGAGSVTVLDRGTVGSGMSSRSSALVRMHYTFPPEVDLAVRSDAMFDAWTDLTGRPSCVRRTGFVRLVAKEETDLLRANVCHAAAARRARRGRRRRRACEACAQGCAPTTSNAPRGNRTVAMATARSWQAICWLPPGTRVRSTGRIRRVRSLVTDGERVLGVRTDDGAVYAGIVVLAAGVWSPPLLGHCRCRSADRDRAAPRRGHRSCGGRRSARGLHRLDNADILPSGGGRGANAHWQLHRDHAAPIPTGSPRPPPTVILPSWSDRRHAAFRHSPSQGSPPASPACTT